MSSFICDVKEESFSSYLILCSFFLSVANILGAAGKIPSIDSEANIADTYRALISYTSGVISGCFLARMLERYSIKEKIFLIRNGAVLAGFLSAICLLFPPKLLFIPNGFLGLTLGSVIIELRAVLGRENNQEARTNLTIISMLLSGMSIFVPLLVLKFSFDKIQMPYFTSAICCLLAWLMISHSRQGISPWIKQRRPLPRTDLFLRKTKFNLHTIFAIASLASMNTSVLMTILTLPIAGVTHVGITLEKIFFVGACVWLFTNTVLLLIRKRVSLRFQLLFGLILAIVALIFDISSLALNSIWLYIEGQIPVYVAAIFLQATLFTRIAQTVPLSVRAFGAQSALQVGVATLIVIVNERFSNSITPVVSGQVLMLAIAITSSVVMLRQWHLQTQI